MSAFEYLLLFAAVILGLAVSDIVISVHRLLGAGARVRWDALAPLAALVGFLKIVTQWWTWHGAADLARGFTFEMFLAVLASCVLLFLLAAAALPDEVGPGGVDLAAHYEQVRRRYWLLFLAHMVLGNAVAIWSQVAIGGARFDWRTLISPTTLIGLVALSLVFVRNRWVNGLVLAGLVVLYVGQLFGRGLP